MDSGGKLEGWDACSAVQYYAFVVRHFGHATPNRLQAWALAHRRWEETASKQRKKAVGLE